MREKILALLTAIGLVLTCTACGGGDDMLYLDDNGNYVDESGNVVVESSELETSSGTIKGLSMTVLNTTGELQIQRDMPLTAEIPDDDTWTIFIYVCGTDLESKYGSATGDIVEMQNATASGNVRFILETGGCSKWQNEVIKTGAIQRYVIQDGTCVLLDEQPDAAMGNYSTLASFLDWGTQNYPSEHMGVVMWNHGGGSISGICFDECAYFDSLSLMELDNALYETVSKTQRKFDFIGFDACLMGTLETANVLASYADYMVGSEETEPGSGWDYTSIGNYLASNSDASGAEVGKVICDSFLAACRAVDQDYLTTLSVIDLSQVDNLLISFNSFAKDMYEAAQDSSARSEMVRAINSVDNFGGNNKTEGYTNMVDLGGIVSSCSKYSSNASNVMGALNNAVLYKVSGDAHQAATGLSMYYPLSIQGSMELSIFGKVCTSPYYLSFVDSHNQAASPNITTVYDDNQWFDENGEWEWGAEEVDDSYWDYMDSYEVTGESPYITFAQEPVLLEDGSFYFALDQQGYDYAADVLAMVCEIYEDEDVMIELGETIDVQADWSTGEFMDMFDGLWLSLADGQNLALYVVEVLDDSIIYTSPIYLNGQETNLRMRQYFSDGRVEIEGAWEGIDENGAAARDVVTLKSGDVIVPVYTAYSLSTDDEYEYTGSEYVVTDGDQIYYDLMEPGLYGYFFCINDIFGDYLLTDSVLYDIDEDGTITFSE